MVRGDVKLDINGIPEKLPEEYYMRMPLLKTEDNSYEDWKRRRGKPSKLLVGTKHDIERLQKEVAQLEWEINLRQRPAVTQGDISFNKKIVGILDGKVLNVQNLMERIEAESGSCTRSIQSK